MKGWLAYQLAKLASRALKWALNWQREVSFEECRKAEHVKKHGYGTCKPCHPHGSSRACRDCSSHVAVWGLPQPAVVGTPMDN